MTRRRPASAPAPMHSTEAHRTISDELVRCTLGGRGPRRTELRVDVIGAMHRISKGLSDLASASARIRKAVRRDA